MKKALCLMLSLALVILTLVPATAEVFTGTSRGMQGDVVVNVTIENLLQSRQRLKGKYTGA